MSLNTVFSEFEDPVRDRIGALLVCMGLLGVCFVLAGVTLRSSQIVLSGVLGCYLPVLGGLIFWLGFHCLPRGCLYGVHLRAASLVCLFCSPFATWSYLSIGNLYLTVNCILWQLAFFECVRLMVRQVAVESQGWHRPLTTTFCQVCYWVFLILVYAPFGARLLDLCWLSYMTGSSNLQAGSLWRTAWAELDFILQFSLVISLLLAGVSCCFKVIFASASGTVASSGPEATDTTETVHKEDDSDGNDIDSGVGCIQ